jgi:uncharacterized protein YndB with AHSA1/START domain
METDIQTEIRQTWSFEHGPETVWEYLVTPELVAKWLMKNDIRPVVGHKFTFATNAIPTHKFDGMVHCEILEVVPNKRLVYSWKGGPGDGTINLDTIVNWTLVPKGNGTELTLLHTGFTKDNQITRGMMNEGWGKHIKDRLTELINKDKQ